MGEHEHWSDNSIRQNKNWEVSSWWFQCQDIRGRPATRKSCVQFFSLWKYEKVPLAFNLVDCGRMNSLMKNPLMMMRMSHFLKVNTFFTSMTFIELFLSWHWQTKKNAHTSEMNRSNWTIEDRIDRRMSTTCHELMVYDAIMTHLQKLHALHNFTCSILLHRWNQWNFVSEMISVLFIRIVLQCDLL